MISSAAFGEKDPFRSLLIGLARGGEMLAMSKDVTVPKESLFSRWHRNGASLLQSRALEEGSLQRDISSENPSKHMSF